jgi:hypothetical protein
MADAAAACRRRAALSVLAALAFVAVGAVGLPLWLATGPLSTGLVAGWSALTLYSKGATRVRWLGIAAVGAFTPLGVVLLIGLGPRQGVVKLLFVQLPYVLVTVAVVVALTRSPDAARDYWVDDAYDEHPLNPFTWGHHGGLRI